MIGQSWLSDKYRLRGPVLLFNSILALIGLPIIAWHPQSSVRYFGVFLTTMGVNSNLPAIMTFQANNVVGQWKRAFSSASTIAFGGIGGIAGSLVFRNQDAPHYYPGIYASIACCALVIFVVILLDVQIYLDNKRQAKGEVLEDTASLICNFVSRDAC